MKEFVFSDSRDAKDHNNMEQEAIAIEQKTVTGQGAASGKLAFASNMLVLVIASAAIIALFQFWRHPLSFLLQCVIFILAGVVHVSFVRTRLPLVTVAGEWIYTLVMTVLAAGLLRSAELWGPVLPLRLILTCAAVFLLPFVLSETWQAKLQLAWQNARAWYPSKERLVQYPSFYFNSTPVQFRIHPGKGGSKESIVFRVSNEMSLGQIFFDLVQNKLRKHGKEIALTDAGRNPFHWMFFTADGVLFSRALDPEKTIGQNRLKENAVIYAQKIYEQDFALLNDYKSENN